MAHFGQVSHTASGALANSGMHHNLGEIPAPSVQNTNAKQRRLSRPNTVDEIRRKNRKRRKRRSGENKLLSKKQKKEKLVARLAKQNDKLWEVVVKKTAIREIEVKKKAAYFQRKWKEENMRKNNLCS